MAISSLVESKDLRAQGVRIGRDGMSQRAHNLIEQYLNENPIGNYKKCIELVGRLHAIYIATGCDQYWREKAYHGYEKERHDILNFKLIEIKCTSCNGHGEVPAQCGNYANNDTVYCPDCDGSGITRTFHTTIDLIGLNDERYFNVK